MIGKNSRDFFALETKIDDEKAKFDVVSLSMSSHYESIRRKLLAELTRTLGNELETKLNKEKETILETVRKEMEQAKTNYSRSDYQFDAIRSDQSTKTQTNTDFKNLLAEMKDDETSKVQFGQIRTERRELEKELKAINSNSNEDSIALYKNYLKTMYTFRAPRKNKSMQREPNVKIIQTPAQKKLFDKKIKAIFLYNGRNS